MKEDLCWRILVDDALPGAANMARDHAIAEALAPGTGTVRFYRWSPPTLSLGRNEPATSGYRDFLRRRPEVGVVRRPTGGRAVVHDRELTYAVALPARAFGGPRGAYRKVTEGLLEGLRRLGVEARAAGGRVLPLDAGPCFLEAAEGEIAVRGRKLVGSAQVRIGGAVLQHGSVLPVADQGALVNGCARADGPGGALDRAGPQDRAGPLDPAGNGGVVPGETPAWQRLVRAFGEGFARVLGGKWQPGRWTESEQTLAAELENRYGSAEWTWRR